MFEFMYLGFYLYADPLLIALAIGALISFAIGFQRAPGKLRDLSFCSLVFCGATGLLLLWPTMTSMERLIDYAVIDPGAVDATGVVLAHDGAFENPTVLLEIDGRERVFVQFRAWPPLSPGDSITLSTRATPRAAFSVPVLCRDNDCWALELRGSRPPGVCAKSSADACRHYRRFRS